MTTHPLDTNHTLFQCHVPAPLPAAVSVSQKVLSWDQPWSIASVGAARVASSGMEMSVSRPRPSKLGISPEHFTYETLSEVVTFEQERPSLLAASCASVGGASACAPAARVHARKTIAASSFEVGDSIGSGPPGSRLLDRRVPAQRGSDTCDSAWYVRSVALSLSTSNLTEIERLGIAVPHYDRRGL